MQILLGWTSCPGFKLGTSQLCELIKVKFIISCKTKKIAISSRKKKKNYYQSSLFWLCELIHYKLSAICLWFGLAKQTIIRNIICFVSKVTCSSNSGTWDAIIKMIRYEGLNGFYKGMGTKIVQSVLAAAVLFMVKEELVKQTRFLLTKPKPLWMGNHLF